MATSDILTRVASFVMVLSALWNGIVSILFIATMIWFLVGFFWFVPLILAFVNVFVALVFMVVGHNKASIVGPLIGMVISFCNLNFFGFALDLIGLALMIGGYVARSSEDRAAADLAFA